MRRLTRGLRAAIEEERVREGENTSRTPAEALEPAADSLETDLLEVADSDAEGELQDAEMAEAGEVAEALESLRLATESAIQLGGMDRIAAGVVIDQMDFHCARLGLAATRRAMPAMESFGSTGRRMESTVALEASIADKAKEIWKAIVDGIKRAIAWIVDHYNKYFGAAEKLEKRAKSVVEAAEKTTGKQDTAPIENAALFKKLYIGSDVPADLKGAFTKVKTLVDAVMVKDMGDRLKAAEALSEALSSTDKAKTFKLSNASPVPNLKAVGDAEGFPGEQEKTTLSIGEALPGGKAYGERAPKEELTGTEALLALSKVFDDIVPADPKAKAPSKETVKPVTSNDAGAIATTVGDVAVSLIGFRKNISKLTDTLKKVASSAEKAASGAASETEEETKKLKLALQKASANIVRASVYGPQQVGKYALETCKAGLDLCELSLKKYSTEK